MQSWIVCIISPVLTLKCHMTLQNHSDLLLMKYWTPNYVATVAVYVLNRGHLILSCLLLCQVFHNGEMYNAKTPHKRRGIVWIAVAPSETHLPWSAGEFNLCTTAVQLTAFTLSVFSS